MLLSYHTCGMGKTFGMDQKIKMLADAGFDAVDFSFPSLTEEQETLYHSADRLKEMARLRALADDCGVVFNQAHSAFPSSFDDADKTAAMKDKIICEMENAAALGVKCIVVHPMQHLPYLSGNNDIILRRMNLEFYSSLLPYAKEFGIKIATENMWQRSVTSKNIIESVCGSETEFCDYIDMIHDEYFVACLDLGHCGLVGVKPESMIRSLGHDRLHALHVHDNNFLNDHHVLPYTPFIGKADWDEICKALAEIEYDGDFTYECNLGYADEYTAPPLLQYAHNLGRELIQKIEDYKAAK